VRRHTLAREPTLLRIAVNTGARASSGRREQPILHIGHPEVALLNTLVDQPHGARVALAFIDHRFRQPTEEAFDVGLADKEVERELYDFGLHARAALRAAIFERLAQERRTQHLRIV
jgi:hypothetical protein